MSSSTIVALSSGGLPAGVAILRVSGQACQDILGSVLLKPVKPSELGLRKIVDPADMSVIDIGLVNFRAGPYSFTGEDVIEFNLHGSVAVVQKLLSVLLTFKDVRLAGSGEFTRRAFENSKLDLVEIEGLGDLLSAETECQRVQALARFEGGLSSEVFNWRQVLLTAQAEVEANLDFSDEEDVGSLDFSKLASNLKELSVEISDKLAGYEYGRIVREGLRVIIVGRPNVGKSSIINALSLSNRVIVTGEAGTTRDIVDVKFELNGQLITLLDSAGIRNSDSLAESAGIDRTLEMINLCDLVIWVSSPDIVDSFDLVEISVPFVHVVNKSDLCKERENFVYTNALAGDVAELKGFLVDWLEKKKPVSGSNFVSRLRDKNSLQSALGFLKRAIDMLSYSSINSPGDINLEFLSEELRLASFALERILGGVDSEQVLGKIFEGFCIGK